MVEEVREGEGPEIDPMLYGFIHEAIPEIPNDANIIVGQLISEVSDLTVRLDRLEAFVKKTIADNLAAEGMLDAAAFVRRTIDKE